MASLATSSRKRKPAEDVNESPPKRLTRSRAAKAIECSTGTSANTGPKPTRITTASARIAAEARGAVVKSAPKSKTTTTKRKARIADNKSSTTAAPKSRTRTKEADKQAVDPNDRPRVRAVKTRGGAEKLDEQPRTRTRKTDTDEIEALEPAVKRTTRAQSATIDMGADSTQIVVKKTVKRVTFQEDLIQEKENRPLPMVSKKAPLKARGIKAKPVRQPAKLRTSTRGRKAIDKIEEKPAPLSPKKVTQIAKSISSSEDELARTPSKMILKSPTRLVVERPSTPVLLSKSPISAPSIEHEMEILLGSPAKRPPPSPFKEGFNQSPKKFPLPTVMPDFTKMDDKDKVQRSFRISPKKFDFTPLKMTARSKEKSGAIERAALLSTPARRPASPLKLGSVRLPEKTAAANPLTNTISIMRHGKDSSLFSTTPRRLFGNSVKISGKRMSPVKISESALGSERELPTSAEDPTISEEHRQTPFGFKKYSETVRFAEPKEIFEHDVFEESGHYRSVDDASEDELSLGPLTSSPRKSALTNRRLPSSPSNIAPTPKHITESLFTPKPRAKNTVMTPLAVQFSSWFATNPSRSNYGEDTSKEAFTPVAEAVENCTTSHRLTMTPGARSSYFEDQLDEIEIKATPEESMQNLDLHSDKDVVMSDGVVPDINAEIISATPEGLLQQNLHDQSTVQWNKEEDEVELIAESFEILPDEMVVEHVEDQADWVEDPTPDEEIIMFESESAKIAFDEQDHSHQSADTTVIITREELAPEAVHSTPSLDYGPPVGILAADQTLLIGSSTAEIRGDELRVEDCINNDGKTLIIEDDGNKNTATKEEISLAMSNRSEPTNDMLRTPIIAIDIRRKEARTIERVPLKPASDDSPMQIKVRNGRSKSMSAPLGEPDFPKNLLFTKNRDMVSSKEDTNPLQTQLGTPRSVSQPLGALVRPEVDLISLANSPFKSVRKGQDAQILNGAVVFVDVHTCEGADASGIFIELLTQMGARCIKQWNWNSRSTLEGGEDPAMNIKPGITHVVFKDGSKRTLQKVREAKGAVLCVGVGWVLE